MKSFDSQLASLRPANYSLRTFDMEVWLAMSEPFGSPQASWKASRMVRKKGLEPSRYCYRQPLKLANSLRCSGLTQIRRTDPEPV